MARSLFNDNLSFTLSLFLSLSLSLSLSLYLSPFLSLSLFLSLIQISVKLDYNISLVFLGFMLPFGIVGNASVIYIYGFRLKKSNIHLFIALLAVSDTISCLVGIPMEIYRMCFFYNYPSVATCKTEGFFTFACYICSMLMLLTISVERYVKVCRSTKTQVSRKVAKILAGVVFLVSSLLAIPLPVFAAPFPYTLDNGVVVHNCTYHIEPELWYYCIIFFVVLIGVLVAMFILYREVLKTAKHHVTWTLQRKARSSNDAIDATQAAKTVEDKKLSQTNRTVIWISVVYAASCIPIFTIAMSEYFECKFLGEIHRFHLNWFRSNNLNESIALSHE
ncbi:unnamed protein product [Acanthosepion pharaonis]|uniref:G-protein coupled receptors family 1 profile domain-containing protein n=1 Tax=Acanthosepion pharaonis TaxID=158019 RepID=A0A812CYF3_ACAPH|nr:unnamed protein product [Sepia pharaonis]